MKNTFRFTSGHYLTKKNENINPKQPTDGNYKRKPEKKKLSRNKIEKKKHSLSKFMSRGAVSFRLRPIPAIQTQNATVLILQFPSSNFS